jgi:hypothetical protein
MTNQPRPRCTNGHTLASEKAASKFCALCGAPIVVTCPLGHEVRPAPYCSVCGAQLPPNWRPPPRDGDGSTITASSPRPTDANVEGPRTAHDTELPESLPLAGSPTQRPGRGLLAILGAVLLAILIGTGAYFGVTNLTNSGSGKTADNLQTPEPPSPTADEQSVDARRQQATDIDNLLGRSAVDRHGVSSAIGEIERCTNLTAARKKLSVAATKRAELVRDLDRLELSALPGGETLRVDLEDGWDASADSDRSYASWAVEAGDAGCPPGGPAPHTPSYNAAQSTDQLATESKEAFVSHWNPIASDYGLAQRTARSF